MPLKKLRDFQSHNHRLRVALSWLGDSLLITSGGWLLLILALLSTAAEKPTMLSAFIIGIHFILSFMLGLSASCLLWWSSVGRSRMNRLQALGLIGEQERGQVDSLDDREESDIERHTETRFQSPELRSFVEHIPGGYTIRLRGLFCGFAQDLASAIRISDRYPGSEVVDRSGQVFHKSIS